MSGTYRTVRLIQNQLYPTYQLHAVMANKKTLPQDGLRLAALITIDWIRRRLGENLPKEVQHAPKPSAYRSVTDDCLTSFHIHSGFVVDVVALPGQGIWSLQITEPDLGSDPGNHDQRRQAVPGRVIETNIGYRVVGAQLECGFQTVISDPEGTVDKAEVYRLAVVRQLLKHPDFGLRQITTLGYEAVSLDTVAQIKNVTELWRSKENALPCVVFTSPRKEIEPSMLQLREKGPLRSPQLPGLPPPPTAKPEAQELPYDIAAFARSGMAYCRTYRLEDSLFERFRDMTGIPAEPGDILVLEPAPFGGGVQRFPYRPSKSRQEETVAKLREKMFCYPRDKTVDFGAVVFLSEARESLLHQTADALQHSEETEELWEQKLALLEARWKAEWEDQRKKYQEVLDQLERQRQYQERLEREKEQLRKEHGKKEQRFEQLLAEKEEDIAYLKRKLSRPREHSEIVAWVKEHFSGRLILHPKAEDLLEDKSARSVSAELICDALDFLATDYWDRRYLRISTEELNSRCSEKYGRPFEVKPTGTTTIEFTPAEYKIKYFPGAKGKPVESPLDFHLGVGNDPENLLRIYFLHDDEKKLIVVGSLPRHLRAVTVQ